MRELSSHEQTLTPFDRLLYWPTACLLCLPFDSPRANDLRLSRHNNTALREETLPTLGEEPLPLLRLTVLIEVFFPFSYGFWGCFPSIPSNPIYIEGVATSRNCNTAGSGTRDIWFCLGRISVQPTFTRPRQLCKCAKVNYPKNKLYIISAFYIEIAKPGAYPPAAFVPVGNGQVRASAWPAAVK